MNLTTMSSIVCITRSVTDAIRLKRYVEANRDLYVAIFALERNALEYAEQRRPRIVIIQVDMADIDPLRTIEQFRWRRAELIFVAALDETELDPRLAAEFDGFIRWDDDIEAIVAKLDALLQESERERPPTVPNVASRLRREEEARRRIIEQANVPGSADAEAIGITRKLRDYEEVMASRYRSVSSADEVGVDPVDETKDASDAVVASDESEPVSTQPAPLQQPPVQTAEPDMNRAGSGTLSMLVQAMEEETDSPVVWHEIDDFSDTGDESYPLPQATDDEVDYLTGQIAAVSDMATSENHAAAIDQAHSSEPDEADRLGDWARNAAIGYQLEGAFDFDDPAQQVEAVDETLSPSIASFILNEVDDDLNPWEGFTVVRFMNNLYRRSDRNPGVFPLPTWIASSQQFTSEPSFRPDTTGAVAVSDESPVAVVPDEPRIAGAVPTDADAGEYTERPAAVYADDDDDYADYIDHDAVFPTLETDGHPSESVTYEMAPEPRNADQPVIRSMPYQPSEALSDTAATMAALLTQTAQDATTAAIFLIRNQRVIATAGQLDETDLNALIDTVDLTGNLEREAMRPARNPLTGRGYMLYQIPVAGRYTLIMIFDEQIDFSQIRQQSRRLAEALKQARERIVVVAEVEVADFGPTQANAYSILLRDENGTLNRREMEQLRQNLPIQMGRLGWRIETIDLADDYISIYGETPQHETVSEQIRLFKRYAAETVSAPDTIWDDSFLAAVPGRRLSDEEVRTFIGFARKSLPDMVPGQSS